MFLALKEIKREKMRYGLIVLMIFLISYLIYMLTGLAFGLASENTQAITSWQTKRVVLNESSNVSLSQSLISKKDIDQLKLTKDESIVGQTPVVAKKKSKSTLSAQFIGLKKSQYIYQDLTLISGRKWQKSNEVVADVAFKQKGYKLGDKVTLNGSNQTYKIVGFAKNAKINIAPILYGNLSTWRSLKLLSPQVAASGIISKRNYRTNLKDLKSYNLATFKNKLPGYKAQNMTFELMIGFLFIISLIIVAVFLYILTMQKLPNFAVMRAQGIGGKTLVSYTIWQSLILVISGCVIALLAMLLTTKVLPAAVPIEFTAIIASSGVLGMIAMGLLGSLIPIRSILRVDPKMAIGG